MSFSLRIFICYRVDDTGEAADRLREDLARVLPDATIFLAERDLETGPWPQRLEAEVRAANVVLVLIGKSWLTPRIYEEGDWVRREIETAFEDPAKLVHPVLIDVDRMPAPNAFSVLPKVAPLCDEQWSRIVRRTRGADIQELADKIVRHFASPSTPRPMVVAPASGRVAEETYLNGLLAGLRRDVRRYAPLAGIARVGVARAEAEDLELFEDVAALRFVCRQPASTIDSRRYEDVLSAFRDLSAAEGSGTSRCARAAVLGRPGAGKTTALRKLAAGLAETALADPAAPLPVLAELGKWTSSGPLAGFLAGAAPTSGVSLSQLDHDGRLVLLLDGLNEMPVATRSAKAKEIRELISDLSPATPVFVSCRAEDYRDDLDLGFDTLTLEPLTPPRVRAILRHWLRARSDGENRADRLFWDLAGDPELAGVLARWRELGASEEQFWSATEIPTANPDVYSSTTLAQDELWRNHVANPRSLLRLASNPFLLMMLYAVWIVSGGRLPRNRAEVFGRFIAALLDREHKASGRQMSPEEVQRTDDILLDRLRDLAWRMQRLQPSPDETGGLTVVARVVAAEALGDQGLLKRALDATILEGGDEIRFRHQLLQEHFAATALRARLRDGSLRAAELWAVDRWWERSGWEEAAVLLAGLYEEDCTPVVRWLMEAQPEVAAQCILESGAKVADREGLFEALSAAWLPRLEGVSSDPAPEARAAVGRALGRLDLDKRKGVAVVEGVPDIDWVDITGGPFIYLGQPDRIESFRIARYPITNAQFAAFVADGGNTNEQWWRGMPEAEREPQAPTWDLPNHPRETVSWYEATAFCAWLSERLGYRVELPSERQWERAAASTDGREYPWGNGYHPGYANIDETWTRTRVGPHYLGRTTPVGIYPYGASPQPERVLDLSGNVWEWCRDEHTTTKRRRRGEERSIARVVRGGSWHYDAVSARASFRAAYLPHYRGVLVGFRVVSASPIR